MKKYFIRQNFLAKNLRVNKIVALNLSLGGTLIVKKLTQTT